MTVGDYRAYKDSIYKSFSKDLSHYEKNFTLLATGILAFSVTFIKEIIKISEAVYLPALFVGWALIVIAIGLMMVSFLMAVNEGNILWKEVDDYLLKNKFFDNNKVMSDAEYLEIKLPTNEILYRVKRRLKIIRYLAIVTFLSGIITFSSFVGINLVHENGKDKSTKILNNKSSITIKTGNTESKTNDSVIVLNH